MKNSQNYMILNGEDIGISRIELNKADLLIFDKAGKYCLKVFVAYNWEDIRNLDIGEKKAIDFNEYCFSEYNEAALVWPTNYYVERILEDFLIFYLKFDDFSEVCYMNKRNRFDIELESLKVKVEVEYKGILDNYFKK